MLPCAAKLPVERANLLSEYDSPYNVLSKPLLGALHDSKKETGLRSSPVQSPCPTPTRQLLWLRKTPQPMAGQSLQLSDFFLTGLLGSNWFALVWRYADIYVVHRNPIVVSKYQPLAMPGKYYATATHNCSV